MSEAKCGEEEFIDLFKTRGAAGVSQLLNIDERSVHRRRRRLEARLGIKISPPPSFKQGTANPKILLLDIETAPNLVYVFDIWNQNIGLSQIVDPGYTLCWSANWYGESKIMFSSIYKDGRAAMVKRIHILLSEADIVIHYNGTKFDIPKLNQEFLKAEMTPPSPFQEIDLLRTVRRKFKLTSNKLDFVARHLGIKGKLKHKGMELWRGCMDGDESSWRTMEAYNKQDIKLLQKVYPIMIPWISNHPSHAVFNVSLQRVCPKCGSNETVKQGIYYTETQAYQKFHCKGCGGWSRERNTMLDKDKRKSVLKSV